MLVPSPVFYTTNPDPEFVNVWQMVVTLITLQNVFFLTRGFTSETYKTFSFNLGAIYYMSHTCRIWLWISFFSHTLALLKSLSGKSKIKQHKKQIIIDLLVWVNLVETTVLLVLTIGPWPSVVHIQHLRHSCLQQGTVAT